MVRGKGGHKLGRGTQLGVEVRAGTQSSQRAGIPFTFLPATLSEQIGIPSGAGHSPQNVNHPHHFSLALPRTRYGCRVLGAVGWRVGAEDLLDGGRGPSTCLPDLWGLVPPQLNQVPPTSAPNTKGSAEGSRSSLRHRHRSERANSPLPTIPKRPDRCRGRRDLKLPDCPRPPPKSKSTLQVRETGFIRKLLLPPSARTQNPPLPSGARGEHTAPTSPQPSTVILPRGPRSRATSQLTGAAAQAACHVGPGPGLQDWGVDR